MNPEEILFPYDKVREVQGELIQKVSAVVENKLNLIAHAPTGLGKTAAVLAPALKYAIENDKTVFFLTSRHTQHLIAIETLKAVKNKHNTVFNAVDIVGKKWLCLQPGVVKLTSGEFAEYCRKMREDNLCQYYTNLKKGDKVSSETKRAIIKLRKSGPQVTEEIVETSKQEEVCPYEISMFLSKDSQVVVTDYFYIFNPKIRESFLKRSGKELENCIVVVDEAHNLPERVKDLASQKISNIILKRAAQEADKYGYEKIVKILLEFDELFENYSKKCNEEMHVSKEEFWENANQIYDYDSLVEELEEIGGKIREEQKRSYIAVVGEFLAAWTGKDEGFARIFSKEKNDRGMRLILSYRCLDPSLVTKQIIDTAHSVILMSGTLNPTHMYKELLGFDESIEQTYPDPFPKENRKTIIIPKTSTKFSMRSEEQYKMIGEILAKVINSIPGNSTAFFPSYYLKEEVYKHFEPKCERTIFNEMPGMSKSEKHDFLEKFKKNSAHGAVLLGVTTGSFAEGIDLPGEYLKGVVIVGLPLQKPDLECKTLIEYYDKKFGKGWDYGYLFPAFNKALQSAGRCIRTEEDRGVIVFLDERYAWNNYRKCFPPDWKPQVTMLYEPEIRKFFSN